jgi:hypothetical protein
MSRAMTRGKTQLLGPGALYGPAAEVRRAAARFVTAVRKGCSVIEAFRDDPVSVDAGHRGLVVLDRRWSSISSDQAQFHLDLPWRQLHDWSIKNDDYAGFERASVEAFAQPWSFVGLLGGQIYDPVRTAGAQLQVVKAAAAHWPVLTAIGARYTQGNNQGELLENLPTLVTFCLARQGAPLDDLGNLTAERLRKHIAHLPGIRVRALLEQGDVAGAVALLAGHEESALLSMAEHFFAFELRDVACEAVARISTSDPYGNVGRWLAGAGKPARRRSRR